MSSSERSAAFEAIIHPYRSLGPVGFAALLGVVIIANAVVATVALSYGAWPVAGFLGLDMLAIYVAFRISYAQARAFERVTINGEALIVERVDRKGKRREWSFPSYWVSVWFEGDDDGGTVTLRSHGRSLEVGRYLAPFERKEFADVLRRALGDAKAAISAPA
jgi:uncharacterized membrane protein